MILEAGFMALLHRYTGQDDIVVGTPISGRTHSETENLIGLFLNTVLLRAKFSERQNFRSLLQQVRERALGAYAHPDLPFEHLVAELAPDRDPSRSPAVPGDVRSSQPGRGVPGFQGVRQSGVGDRNLEVRSDADSLRKRRRSRWIYRVQHRFIRSSRRSGACAGYYARLLEAIVADPEQRVSALPMLH